MKIDNIFLEDGWGLACVGSFVILAIVFNFILMPLIYTSKGSVATRCAAVLSMSIFFPLTVYINNEPLNCGILFIGVLLSTAFIMKAGRNITTWISVSFILHLTSFKAIVIGGYSLIISRNMYVIFNTNDLYIKALIAVNVLCVLSIFIYSNFIKQKGKRIRAFFQLSAQVGIATIIHAFLTVFMLYFSYNYNLSLNLIWFSVAQILTGLCVIGIHWIVCYYSIGMSNTLKRLGEKQISHNINTQMANYETYKANYDLLQTFKHNYDELILSLTYLMKQGKSREALNVMEKDKAHFDITFPNMRRYSNNPIINAMLLTYENLAIQRDIDFKAIIFIPETCPIEATELHSVLTNVFDNAVKESSKAKGKNRGYINAESYYKNGWLSIKVENRCFGKVRLKDKKIDLTKNGNDYANGGISIVKSIFNKYNGITKFEYSEEESKFIVILNVKC